MSKLARPSSPGTAAVAAQAPRAGVSVHIDRVVLEGFRFGVLEQAGLASAMQVELSRLLSAHGFAASPLCAVASPRLDAGELRVAQGSSAQRLGRAIAQSLYRGLVR